MRGKGKESSLWVPNQLLPDRRWKGVLCLCPFVGEKIEAIRGTEMPSSVSFLLLSVQEAKRSKTMNHSVLLTLLIVEQTSSPESLREIRGLAVLLQRGHHAVPLIRRGLVFMATAVIMSSAPQTQPSFPTD